MYAHENVATMNLLNLRVASPTETCNILDTSMMEYRHVEEVVEAGVEVGEVAGMFTMANIQLALAVIASMANFVNFILTAIGGAANLPTGVLTLLSG